MALVRSGVIAAAGTGGVAPVVTPSRGAGQIFPLGPNASSHTASGFSSTTGNVAVRLFGRANGTGVSPLAVTWGGVAVPALKSIIGNSGGKAIVWAGVKRAGPTGANNLVISGANSFGNLIVQIDDIVDLPAVFAGNVAPAATSPESGTVKSSTGPHTLTLAGSASLLLGVGGAVNGGARPYTITSGWTKDAEDDTGGANDTDASAAFVSKVGGTSGGSEACTWSTGAGEATDDWAGLIIELLAG